MVAGSIALVAWLLRKSTDLTQGKEDDFFTRQRRFRIGSAVLLGLVGAMIIISSQVSEPRTSLLLWAGILLLMFVVIFMAVIDSLRIRAYYLQNDLGVSEARQRLIQLFKR